MTGLVLGGCAYPYFTNDLDAAKAPADPFAAALFEGYKAHAKRELAGSEHAHARKFGDIAIALAAGGKPTNPVAITTQKISASDKEQAAIGRELLIEAITRGGGTKAPAQMGRSQTGFDCWVHEMEDAADGQATPTQLAACRTAFFEGLANVEQALKP